MRDVDICELVPRHSIDGASDYFCKDELLCSLHMYNKLTEQTPQQPGHKPKMQLSEHYRSPLPCRQIPYVIIISSPLLDMCHCNGTSFDSILVYSHQATTGHPGKIVAAPSLRRPTHSTISTQEHVYLSDCNVIIFRS